MRGYTVKEYDKSNISQLVWPDNYDADYCRNFIVPMMEEGADKYVANVRPDVTVVKILHIIPEMSFEDDAKHSSPDEVVVPITVNIQEQYESYNCYTASPYHHYISYGLAEAEANPLHYTLKLLIRTIAAVIAFFFRFTNLEKVVIVNNWLVSTNLYSNFNSDQIEAITTFLCAKYPSHAIIYRSINEAITKDLYQRFSNLNFLPIPSRSIYTSDSRDPKLWRVRNVKQDIDLTNRTCVIGPITQGQELGEKKYEILQHKYLKELTTDQEGKISADHPIVLRIVELYNYLYLNKYPDLNVQFTPAFVADSLQNNILNVEAIRNISTNSIDGVVGFYRRVYYPYNEQEQEWEYDKKRTVQTCPIFGYDISFNVDSHPMYKILSVISALDGKNKDVIINQSSGAAQFKRFRGCKGCIEYSCIYESHLPIMRRVPWRILYLASEYIAKPIVKYYKL
ncbi:hypothetical protein AKO1_007726 [Acrasis kona]|uniref:Uncharacterized protein n=1 Tax=Acrasis kona TaxID=1008807 RepID=A0AAW2YRR5_9EUKA